MSMLARLSVIATAVLTGLVFWALFQDLGVELALKGGAPADEVAAVDVLVATLLASLGAWAIHGFLANKGREHWWPFLASTALAVSVIGPAWLGDGEAAVALIIMHIAVGSVLIAGFAKQHCGAVATQR